MGIQNHEKENIQIPSKLKEVNIAIKPSYIKIYLVRI